MKKTKKGKLILNGVVLEKHEMKTVAFFTSSGFDIELIPPSNNQKTASADFLMNGTIWEMKSLQGNSRHTLERRFNKAKHQSQNIVIDIRYNKMDEEKAIRLLEKCFIQSRTCRKMIVLTKSRKRLDYSK